MTIPNPTSQWSLIALSPQLGDLSVPLGVSTSIGRHQDNDIVLASQQISRHHAKFNQIGSTLVLQDLGSSNGTFINGKRIATEAVELAQGDEVGFADILFMVANEALLEPATIENHVADELPHLANTVPVTQSDTVTAPVPEAVTEVVPLPATIISPNIANEQSQIQQPSIEQLETESINSPMTVETGTTSAKPTISNVPIASSVAEPTSQQSNTTQSSLNAAPISEQTISPIIDSNPTPPIIPKKASTQTWLVAIVIVILIVLAIIGTLFLK